MAILKVARLGHPVLRDVAAPIDPALIGTEPINRLIEDMIETCEEYDGAGLAAPQVHQSVRLVVLALEDNEPLRVWINPVRMAALNITHDMLRKNRMINETRNETSQQVKSIEEKIDLALASSRQLEI